MFLKVCEVSQENTCAGVYFKYPISTNRLIYTHGNFNPCSEIDVKVPEQNVQDKDIDSSCTSCTGLITEGSEKTVQEPEKSKRLKGYFCADSF